ncbi:MAG: hypothetical protein JO353_04510, partial [Phycisphaerae bacterium]|nr:hypothetical protein [Phycisphaerae bacterium]
MAKRVSFATVAISIGAAGAFQLAVRFLPYPADWSQRPPSATWIEDRNGVLLATLAAEDGSLQQWVDADEMGPYLPN